LKLFARAPRFCSTRIFALGREDRSFYLLSSLFPPLPRLYRERTGRYPDRKHGPWTSPSFFSALSRGSERRISASRNRPEFRPSRLRRPLFFLSLLSVSLFLLFAFLFVSPSLCPALLPISALFLVHLRLSDRYPVPSITFTSFYRPPVLRNGYVYTGCLVVRALNFTGGFLRQIFAM